MSLCEIQPVGEDPYYTDLSVGHSFFSKDSLKLLKKHPKGLKVTYLDPKLCDLYIYHMNNHSWLSYFPKGVKKRQDYCLSSEVINSYFVRSLLNKRFKALFGTWCQ